MHHHQRYPVRAIVVSLCIVLLYLMYTNATKAQTTVVINVDAANGDNGADGSNGKPVRTIGRALALAKLVNTRGEAVVISIAPGVYRESLHWRSATDAPVTIEAKIPHTAIISGFDVWEDWQTTGALLTHAWTDNWGMSDIPQNWRDNGLNVSIADIVRRRELILINGVRLKQTTAASGTSAKGTYYVDETANTITVNPHETTERRVIEVGRRTRLADIQNSRNLTLRGLVFEGSVISFDQDAVYLNNLTNVLLENNIFRQNNGGGLFLGRSTGVTRGNRFEDNGTVGFTGAYNRNYTSDRDTACRNNWRGGLGGFITWHPAGVKHLHLRNVTYRDLTVCDNQATGLWLDTDVSGALVTGLVAEGNSLHGLYLEASQGAIRVEGALIEGNTRYGVYISSIDNLTMTGNHVSNNGWAGVFIGGNSPTRTSWNHETGQNFELYPARNIRFQGNAFGGLRNSAPAFYYGTGQFFEQFRPTFVSSNNRYWNVDGSPPIRHGNQSPTWYTVSAWQALTGQDAGSVQASPVATATPTPQPTATATASATLQPVFPTNTPTQVQPSATPEFVLKWRIVIDWYEVK